MAPAAVSGRRQSAATAARPQWQGPAAWPTEEAAAAPCVGGRESVAGAGARGQSAAPGLRAESNAVPCVRVKKNAPEKTAQAHTACRTARVTIREASCTPARARQRLGRATFAIRSLPHRCGSAKHLDEVCTLAHPGRPVFRLPCAPASATQGCGRASACWRTKRRAPFVLGPVNTI